MLSFIDFYSLKILLFSIELITRTKVIVFVGRNGHSMIQEVITPRGSFKTPIYRGILKNGGACGNYSN